MPWKDTSAMASLPIEWRCEPILDRKRPRSFHDLHTSRSPRGAGWDRGASNRPSCTKITEK